MLDGMQAIRILRRMQDQGEIKGHLPILACTANAREDQLLEMTEAGFDGVVSQSASKPTPG